MGDSYLCALRSVTTLYELEERQTTIGRDPNNDLVLDCSKGISRFHARLECHQQPNGRGMCFELVDLNSANGTFVNGERLYPNDPHPLAHGDLIFFSAYSKNCMRFEVFGMRDLGHLDANVNSAPAREQMIGGDAAGLRSVSPAAVRTPVTYPATGAAYGGAGAAPGREDTPTRFGSAATNRSVSSQPGPDPRFSYPTRGGSIKCRPLQEVLPSKQGDVSDSPSRKRFRELNERESRQLENSWDGKGEIAELRPSKLPGDQLRHSRIGMNPELKSQLQDLESRIDAMQQQQLREQLEREKQKALKAADPASLWQKQLPLSSAALEQACQILGDLLQEEPTRKPDSPIAEDVVMEARGDLQAPKVFEEPLPQRLLRLATELEKRYQVSELLGQEETLALQQSKRNKRRRANKRGNNKTSGQARTGGFIVGNKEAPKQTIGGDEKRYYVTQNQRPLTKDEQLFLEQTVQNQEEELGELREQLATFLKYLPDGFASHVDPSTLRQWRDRLALTPRLTIEESSQFLLKILDAERLCAEYGRRQETAERRYANLQEQVRNLKQQTAQYEDQVWRARRQNAEKCPEMVRIRQERHLRRRKKVAAGAASRAAAGAVAAVPTGVEGQETAPTQPEQADPTGAAAEAVQQLDQLESEVQSNMLKLAEQEQTKDALSDELDAHISRREALEAVANEKQDAILEKLKSMSTVDRVLNLEKLCEYLEWELLRCRRPEVHSLVIRSSLPEPPSTVLSGGDAYVLTQQYEQREAATSLPNVRALLEEVLAEMQEDQENLLKNAVDTAQQAAVMSSSSRQAASGSKTNEATRPRDQEREDQSRTNSKEEQHYPERSRGNPRGGSNGAHRGVQLYGPVSRQQRGPLEYDADAGMWVEPRPQRGREKRPLSQAERYRSLSNPRYASQLPDDGYVPASSSTPRAVPGENSYGKSPRGRAPVAPPIGVPANQKRVVEELNELEKGFREDWRPVLQEGDRNTAAGGQERGRDTATDNEDEDLTGQEANPSNYWSALEDLEGRNPRSTFRELQSGGVPPRFLKKAGAEDKENQQPAFPGPLRVDKPFEAELKIPSDDAFAGRRIGF
ncbi:unnamed protein product [Amoebophrya sp. A120]|nr:unnamed protein product [Amoebophrya sp. A120]|eukprot:GSA120T00005497001.1